ncbi:hypothetical protein EXIGLDRAFT_843907 [Exidia glandulosa HHB12029]|uniref:F-box domain-containing protein n=1 Tax=Exidia glandulosa HHB12029 TaxID=1314781 RepID=A0A165CD20_EXIGL|nr:hypothetical protein EXIGLDRAFT_843907 [Exidia glandulosa HHB12029]
MSGDDDWMKGLKGFVKKKPKTLNVPPPSRPRPTLDTLPEDIILNICGHLATRTGPYWSHISKNYHAELAPLRAVCRSLRTIVTPLLVRTIELKSEQRAESFYNLINGDSTRSFLGPPDDLPSGYEKLWSAGCVPMADIAPGPYASKILMQSIRHLIVGPRVERAMPLDLRFILQLLPNLTVFELYDSRTGDRTLNRIARIMRAQLPNLQRFVYGYGEDLSAFVTRNPFARALGDKTSLREVELMFLSIGEAPWIMPEDVGFDRDWKKEDDDALGMDSRTVWYRPQLVFPEPQVSLPSRLTMLRLRDVTFEDPIVKKPPPQAIALLREYSPHLLDESIKGKEKARVEEEEWNRWPPSLHPFVRLLRCSASTITELGLEGVWNVPYATIEYAMREIGPRLLKLSLRRYGHTEYAHKVLQMCTKLQYLIMDDNGNMKAEDQTGLLLEGIPETTETLELWPDFKLKHLTAALQDGVLKARVVNLLSDRWAKVSRSTADAKGAIEEGEKCGVRVLVGQWYGAPVHYDDSD